MRLDARPRVRRIPAAGITMTFAVAWLGKGDRQCCVNDLLVYFFCLGFAEDFGLAISFQRVAFGLTVAFVFAARGRTLDSTIKAISSQRLRKPVSFAALPL